MKRRIEVVCGDNDLVPNFTEISNSPNYIFALFDRDGNTVNLNSWIECAYYVNGGWTNDISDFVNGEQVIFFSLIVVSTLYFIAKKIVANRINNS
jgi:hypothetical protein